MNTCQIQQTTKMLKFVPANNSSLKVLSFIYIQLNAHNLLENMNDNRATK